MFALKHTLNPPKQPFSFLHSFICVVGAPQKPTHETINLGAMQTQNTEMIPSQRATLYTSPRGVKTKNAISKQLITDCFSVPHSSDLIGKSCDQIVHFMEGFKVFQTFVEKKAKPLLKSIPSTSTQSNRDLILCITVEKLQVQIHVLVTEIISNLARAAICNSMEELAFFKTSRFYIFPRGAQQNLLFTQNP